MLIVIQRVSAARVDINQETVASVNQGLLILCGFESSDNSNTLSCMLEKVLHYRIFGDSQGKMNLNLQEIKGGLLLVPQFTLLADTKKGLRPSFSKGATPQQGQELFAELLTCAKAKYPDVQHGVFGAEMQVNLCNDGPATFIMSFL